MRTTTPVPGTFAKMIEAAGFDEIDPLIIDCMEGRPTRYRLKNIRVRRERYLMPEIEYLPVMANGREHVYRPLGRTERRRVHLEEALAYVAHPDARLPDGTLVLSEVQGYYLVVHVSGGRKKLCLETSDMVFCWDMMTIHVSVDSADDELYGQDEEVLTDNAITCYELVVPVIPPDQLPDYGPVYGPMVGEDYW